MLFFQETCNAQDSTKKLVLGICGHFSMNNVGHQNINPSIVVNYGKSSIFIGPLLAKNVDPSQKTYLPGLQCGYQFYPNSKKRVFSFFFQYDLNFLSAKLYSDPTDFFWNNNYYFGTRKIEIFNFSQCLSYGFNIHFLKRFYFSTSLGLGGGWYKKEYIWEANTVEVFTTGNNNPNFYIDFLFKAGLGYNFWTAKKRS
jgi:hypothetical protein